MNLYAVKNKNKNKCDKNNMIFNRSEILFYNDHLIISKINKEEQVMESTMQSNWKIIGNIL